MTLQECFKDKPELLEEPEVKKLIEYASAQHLRLVSITKKDRALNDKVLELCMYSNIMLKEGKTPEETLKAIFELFEAQ